MATKSDQRSSKSEKPSAGADILEAQPDWDRMGEIADRLLSTPADRQSAGKSVGLKRSSRGTLSKP